MIVDTAVYENGRRREGEVPLEKAYDSALEPGAFVWIGLAHPTAREFDAVAREFNLHELAVEDAVKAHQRPKIEQYDDVVLIVLKSARYDDAAETIEIGELLVFAGESFVISVRHGEGSPLSDVRERLEHNEELLRCGPAAVVHAIVDKVVDDYSPIADSLEEDIDQVEQEVFSEDRTNPAERIYKLKREVLKFHRATAPLMTALEGVVGGAIEIPEPLSEYFRDVLDHAQRVNDRVEAFDDLLTSALDANLTQVSVRQNDDMRKISAWVAIAAVPTVVGAIYGMNFEHMPELKWELGYPAALLVMLVIAALLYRQFRKAGWL
ncbi:MAG TPA: magnesium/cobalt transporter CorA [Thermoleophilaceae bacterium]